MQVRAGLPIALCLYSLSIALNAHAMPITFEFSGTFNRVLFDEGEVSVGDSFTGSFSYNDETPLFQVISPGTRTRFSTGAISLTTATTTYAATDRPQLQIFNDHPVNTQLRDDFFLSVYIDDTVGAGFYLLQLAMIDTTYSILDDVIIPNKELVRELGTNNLAIFLRRFSEPGAELWQASAFSSTLSVPVSEPRSLVLLLLFAVLVCAHPRQSRCRRINSLEAAVSG